MAISTSTESPGCEDVIGSEMELVAADPGERAGRGANLGGEVREGGDVVPVERDGVGELAAGDLHAVAGIPGEADHCLVYLFRLDSG